MNQTVGLKAHTPATQALHWAAAAILVAAFMLGLLMEDMPRGSQRDYVMMLHYSLGALVLGATLLRLFRYLLLPSVATSGSSVAAMVARSVHWLLYVAMVGLPLAGALDRWARGRRLTIFGDILVPAPFLIPGGRLWGELHKMVAWSLLALVTLHVAAALWHHFVLRDDVLRRMLPGRFGRTRNTVE